MATATKKKAPKKKEADKRVRYDWSTLFDGKKHHLKAGKDFDTVKNFKCAAYMAAKRQGLQLEFVVAEDQKSLGFCSLGKKKTKKADKSPKKASPQEKGSVTC